MSAGLGDWRPPRWLQIARTAADLLVMTAKTVLGLLIGAGLFSAFVLVLEVFR